MKQLGPILAALLLHSGCERQEPSTATPESGDTPPPKPMVDTDEKSWRDDPQLKPRLNPDYPDDLQVVVHDGGPRITETSPELVWARVTGKVTEGRFIASVLNKPHGLTSVSEGGEIEFMIKEGWEHPVLVRSKYLEERSDWTIHPCDKCGFDELFDAPSDLTAKIFPDVPKDAVMDTFTSFCPLCGGVQGVQHKSSTIED